MSDPRDRLLPLLLTAGHVVVNQLLDRTPPTDLLHGDRLYNSPAVQWKIEESEGVPNIPPPANQRLKSYVSP